MAIFDTARKQLQKLFGKGHEEHTGADPTDRAGMPADLAMAQNDGVVGFAHTVIGHSHEKKGTVCQDASIYIQKAGYTLIAVSDGHGSGNFPRSDRGSRFACQAAASAADTFVRDFDPAMLEEEGRHEAAVVQLCKNILLQWNAAVEADWKAEPITEEEAAQADEKYRAAYLNGERCTHAYGTTLLAVLMTPKYILAIRNGDGQCVTIDRTGGFDTPIPWNDKCRANMVTSLCDYNAIQEFRVWFSKDLPAAVFIGTDGIDNSYPRQADLFGLYCNICTEALRNGLETAGRDAAEFLPKLTQQGSRDDVSMAGILSGSALRAVQTELEAYLAERQRLKALEASKRQLARLNRELKELHKRLDLTEQHLQDSMQELEQVENGSSSWSTIPGLEPTDAELEALMDGIRTAECEITDLKARQSDLSEAVAAEKEKRAQLEAAAPGAQPPAQ
ncbi:MAG: protein phosphatase 2C domain-containing protein [Clostridia bacterium]|nr:protein phosphatase 2C domain-containing protein [Clostridia bacterium]